jgi:hypothetical protein
MKKTKISWGIISSKHQAVTNQNQSFEVHALSDVEQFGKSSLEPIVTTINLFLNNQPLIRNLTANMIT